ncbi:hypothetical protein QQ020_31755 [Fulvivirgaceae bacterium BMA12]|uniref:DUF3575 domain-containing protein n=1 Tax=Agaribacillus aureus TaxID=3051825 RepID=A0ABT8LFW8_9BACT|nr:hypothetical protein [Fulvivirgaceae bacterium BMA12]
MSTRKNIYHLPEKNTLATTCCFFLTIFFVITPASSSSAQTHAVTPGDTLPFYQHKISLLAGFSLKNNNPSQEFGLNYSYQITRTLAPTAQWAWRTEVNEHYYVIGAYIKPTKTFEFLIGIGQRFSRDEDSDLVRIGLKYDLKVGPFYVSPMANLDILGSRQFFDQIQGQKVIHAGLLLGKHLGVKK